jgi:hypothetical protein
VEIDTAADAHYDATGLGRVLVSGAPLELVLGMPCAGGALSDEAPHITMAPGCRPPSPPVAIGAAWLAEGQWTSLAELGAGLTARTHVTLASANATAFEVRYEHEGRGITVMERYVLQPRQLYIRCEALVAGQPPGACALIIPVLVTDGATLATTRELADAVVIFYRGCIYRIMFDPAHVTATIAEEQYANRNAVYRSLTLTGRHADAVSATLVVEPA